MANINPSNSKSNSIKTDEEVAPFQRGTNYLLLIAIDEYEHCPRLYNCVKDANDMLTELCARYHFDRADAQLFFNSDATKDGLDDAFRWAAKTVTAQDNLLIYFSGHGEFDELTNRGFWVPFEAKKGKYSQYISNSDVRDYITAIKSHHTFLVVDSCFSGSLFIGKGTEKNLSRRSERDPSRWGLTSGKLQIVSDGKPGDNSPFAEALLYRLRNTPSAIDVASLCAYVVEQVEANTQHQSPVGEPLRVEGHKSGQFIFHLQADEAQDWKAAEATNTPAAYEHFLKKYPGTGTRQQAGKEAAAYLIAKETRRRKDLMHFLDAFPDSAHEDEVEQWLAAVEQEEAWSTVHKRSYVELRKFLKEHPNSRFREEARQLMADLKAHEDKEQEQNEAAAEAERLKNERLQAEAEAERVRKQAAEAKKPNWMDEANQLPLADIRKNKPLGHFAQQEQSNVPDEQKPLGHKIANAPPALVKVDDPFKDLMIPIAGGKFMMGDEHGDLGASCLPVREVSVKDFYLCKYPVTQAQWRTVMGSDPPELGFPGCDQCPVERVSWDGIQLFLKTLHEKTGLNYRLPSEAEWEFAARGGKLSKKFKYSGSDNLDEVGWFRKNSGSKTHPVGGKKANELGLHDMSGNVWEWCQDVWHDDYKGAPTDGSAWTSGGEERSRVLRGGSWYYDPENCRSAVRGGYNPDDDGNDDGFRVAQGR